MIESHEVVSEAMRLRSWNAVGFRRGRSPIVLPVDERTLNIDIDHEHSAEYVDMQTPQAIVSDLALQPDNNAQQLPPPLSVIMVYEPYGHRQSLEAKPVLGYTGQRMEVMLRGYLLGNGYRVYNPVLMRFVQVDSLSPFNEGGLNGYGYCAGDPVNRTDPSGRMFKTKTGLTRFLRQYDLPKSDLKPYLKSLKRPENYRETRVVYRLVDAEFEKFEFLGAPLKIVGKKGVSVHASQASGNFWNKGNLYIPASAPHPPAALKTLGFTNVRYDYLTWLDQAIASLPPSMAPRSSLRSTTDGNLYVTDPTIQNARTRGAR